MLIQHLILELKLYVLYIIAAIMLLVSTFILLASSMHCRCTEGKTKCTSCVLLQRGLKLHACIYSDIVQEGVVELTFETVGD